jgi:type IV pilus assembly protein PilM
VAGYLKLLLKKIKPNSSEAIASLSSFAVFSTLIELPLMSNEDTVRAMNFQIKQFLPIPISSVTLDWLKVSEKTDEDGSRRQQIFLTAIPTNYINNYKNIFSKAGLKLLALEVEGMSLARSLTSNSPEATLIIDIGSRSTAMIVAENGLLNFSGQTDFGGSSLTQSLATAFNIAPKRAEMLKKQRGLTGLENFAEKELSTQLLTMLDVILNEVQRFKNNYQNNYRQIIDSIVLSGGGANLLGIEKYFSQEVGLPSKKADSLAPVDCPVSLDLLRNELGPLLAVAIGLAMKGL